MQSPDEESKDVQAHQSTPANKTYDPLIDTGKRMADPHINLKNPQIEISLNPTDAKQEEAASPDPFQGRSAAPIEEEEEQTPEIEQALEQARRRQQQMMRQYQQLNVNAQPAVRSQKRIPTMLGGAKFSPSKAIVASMADESEEAFERYEQLNESMIDLDLEKKQSKLNYKKAMQYVKLNSPTTDKGEYYTCCEACCLVNTGYHCCGETTYRSDLEKYGVGMVLYFKFLKYLIFYFVIFAILSIPSLYYCISAFTQYNSYSSLTLNYVLQATTVGSIGLGATSCGLGQIPSQTSDTSKQLLSFSCTQGTLLSSANILYGLVTDESQSCDLYDTSDVNTSCNAASSYLDSSWTACVGQSSCSIYLKDTFFDVSSTSCKSKENNTIVYMIAYCNVPNLSLGSNTYVSKGQIAIILAAFDAAILVVYLIMVIFLRRSISLSTRNVLQYQYSAKLYSVVITRLPEMSIEELYNKLWAYIEKGLNEDRKGGPPHRIVDIQLATSNKVLDYQVEIGELTHRKHVQIREFVQKYFPKNQNHKIPYSSICEIMYKINKNDKIYSHAEKAFKKLQKIHEKKRFLEDKIKAIFSAHTNKVYAAFVTFERMESRIVAINKLSHTSMSRFLDKICSCCMNRKGPQYFEGKLIKVNPAEDPSNVIWSNLEKSNLEVFFRRLLSFVLTLVLLLGTSLIVIASTNAKTIFAAKYPTIDCTNLNPTIAQVSADYNQGTFQKGLLQCYCLKDVVARLYTVFPDSDNQELCLTYLEDRALTYSLTFAIVFGVIVINYIVQYLFNALSQFEKHKTLTDQLGSRVIKVFIGQFINTGVLILGLNARYSTESNGNWFFRGKYLDLNTLWYLNIGSTLMTTMIINVATYPGLKLLDWLLLLLRRCCDRKCTLNPTKTRQKTQKKYQELYLGNKFLLDFRYSQILTLVFICFVYNAGLPLLVITTLIQLILSYFVDRFLLLKASRKPDNFDEDLEIRVQETLYYISFVHVVFAIWIFGNTDIFQSNTSSQIGAVSSITSFFTAATSNEDSNKWLSKFFYRFTLVQNVVLDVLGIIIVVIFLVYFVLLRIFRILRNLCAKRKLSEDEGAVAAGEEEAGAEQEHLNKSNEKQSLRNMRQSYRSLSRVTHDSACYYDLLTEENIKMLLALNQFTLQDQHDDGCKKLFKKKIDRLRTELKKRQTISSPNPDANSKKLSFVDAYSYDIRLHPHYKELFALEELLQDSPDIESNLMY